MAVLHPWAAICGAPPGHESDMMQIDWSGSMSLRSMARAVLHFGFAPDHKWTWQCCAHGQLLAEVDALIFGALAITRPLSKAKPKVCRSEVEIDPHD